MLKDKNIIFGVTAGIAAYKAVDVVSRLKKLKANVEVVMTQNATKFVSPLTFQTLALNAVHVDMFKESKDYDVEHISIAEKADVFLIAPATANIIGKIASGISDDLLTTTIMATKAKVIFAPAMNTNMYRNPIVQRNINCLMELGYEFIEPGVGRLACQAYGEGRMAEPEDIVEYIKGSFCKRDLEGKRILITAGPTIEPLDPVRYMTNHSSGKMGFAIANEAKKRGADVVLISGPTTLNSPRDIRLIRVETTMEMFNAVEREFAACHALIKAAAPLDYRPETVSDVKIKKKEDGIDELNIKYIRNPDIISYFGNRKTRQIVVGFAAETNNVVENAQMKLSKKNLDFIVANDITKEKAGFKTDTNLVTIIDKDGEMVEYPVMDKSHIAKIIVDKVKDLMDIKS